MKVRSLTLATAKIQEGWSNSSIEITVEPPNKGHFGIGASVLYLAEVVPSGGRLVWTATESKICSKGRIGFGINMLSGISI